MHDIHHDHGLRADLDALARLQRRRTTLRWLGAGALAALAGCGGGSSAADAAETNGTLSAAGGSGSGTCSVIPSETSGPFPGDGTNTASNGGVANALAQSGIVRSNIVASFGAASGAADGIPLGIRLQLVDASGGCGVLSGYAVYLWHCDALGRYSMYSQAVAGENYLRGVQVSDAQGVVNFTSIFPGCYDGRWPHLHFEVFTSLERATSGNNDVKTSQVALPAAAAAAVYGDARYTGSSANLSRISLASDMVFSDGAILQTPALGGSNADGYTVSLQVGVPR